MEEDFEKWAKEKAEVWAEGLTKLRKEHKYLDKKGLKYVIIKAFKAGHAYDNNVEKQS